MPTSEPVRSGAGGKVTVALAARGQSELASRVRRDLERDGIVIEEMGIAAAGQHTVVTVRVPAAARPALERLAERWGYSLSYVDDTNDGSSAR